VLAAEEYIKSQLEKVEYLEKQVLDDISHIMKVMQVVRIKMNEQGIDEQFTQFKLKKEKVREQRELMYPTKKRDEKGAAKEMIKA
jgi:hypothetical protein